MSTFSKNFVRVLGVLLLLMLTAAPMRDADAAMPRAGQQIGTRATITYRDAMDVAHARQSDVVYTRIAQVYQINIVAMLDTARAGAGEDADIPFQIANIGNGIDDVSVTVKNFPLGVDEVTIYSADAGGVAKPSTGVRTSKYHQNEFVLKGIKPGTDKPRYIVLRMPLPATSSIGDEFKIDLVARMKNGESKSFGAAAVVSDKTAFSVTPGRSATLYEDKKTMVSFWVKGGPNATRGYFQIWAVKSSDLSTPLSYEVGKKVYFGSETLNRDEIDDSDDKLFKIARPVGANRRYMIKLPITIPDAMRGDDVLMFVKYGEAEEYGVKPLAQEGDLARSAGLVIRFNHKAVSPKLEVTGNSAGGAGPDFSVVEHAVSGDTIDYALTLYNNSTFPDSFVLEEQTGGKGALIAKVTPMDIDGMQPIAVGASGLPEVGPIEANGKREFKIRIRLRDGRVSRRRQGVQFRFRAVRATGVDEIAKAFSISEVVPGSEPVVQFLSESGGTSPSRRPTAYGSAPRRSTTTIRTSGAGCADCSAAGN